MKFNHIFLSLSTIIIISCLRHLEEDGFLFREKEYNRIPPQIIGSSSPRLGVGLAEFEASEFCALIECRGGFSKNVNFTTLNFGYDSSNGKISLMIETNKAGVMELANVRYFTTSEKDAGSFLNENEKSLELLFAFFGLKSSEEKQISSALETRFVSGRDLYSQNPIIVNGYAIQAGKIRSDASEYGYGYSDVYNIIIRELELETVDNRG